MVDSMAQLSPNRNSATATRLRVATLVDGLHLDGGAERLALRVATNLDPERFHSTLCVSRWPQPQASSFASSPKALTELEDDA